MTDFYVVLRQPLDLEDSVEVYTDPDDARVLAAEITADRLPEDPEVEYRVYQLVEVTLPSAALARQVGRLLDVAPWLILGGAAGFTRSWIVLGELVVGLAAGLVAVAYAEVRDTRRQGAAK